MRPYGAQFSQSPDYLKRGGAPDGYFSTHEDLGGYEHGDFWKGQKARRRLDRVLKRRQRRYSKQMAKKELG